MLPNLALNGPALAGLLAGSSVRQHWASTDPKGAWVTTFDGLYPHN